MDQFLQQNDELAARINAAATLLYEKLKKLDPDALGMPEYCLNYYKVSHSQRLFFSIETSANLLYRSFSLIKKNPEEAVVMDYGAGVGSLYLLAKMIGCRQVIYNDHLEDWKLSAELIANAIDVHIDHYIVGDIGDCFDRLEKFNIGCDFITSRNVIEHIYRLDHFYETIHKHQPRAVVVASTTANNSNPVAVVKHQLWHIKW
jgi:2-polyprenyl-3-methyl-5-hydroxy-6-metoxy-1,4-benzoquinol methylase